MKKTRTIAITTATVILLAGCSFGHKVENSDIVHVVFTGTFVDNSILETKEMTITEGSGEIIKGLEEALLGMKKGETKTVTIAPEKGYGSLYMPNNVQKISKLIFDKLQVATNSSWETNIGGLTGVIKGSEADANGNQTILFDLNKPETWQELQYSITVQSINE